MNKKITRLMAALALLLFIAPPMVGWGQTKDTQTVSYGWETTDDAEPWTISEAIVATSGQGNTGEYAGKINTNTTVVQFNEKVYVTSFSYAFKRTSTNNNYSVYIETSTDGQTWSIKDTQAMNTFSNGTYRTVTKEFDGSQELYVRFRCNNTTAVRYVDDITITYATSAAQLEPCDLTLTNASTSIVFDLYNNSDPYVITYTTSSTGEVTVADSEYITTEVDQINKTITVTPVAITNGAKVITVNQAADENYAAGSKTFTINITDSTPFAGGDVTFAANVDKDLNNTTQGEGSITKNGVTFACNNGILGNGSEYRLYKNSETTFTTTYGTITSIVFTQSGNYSISNLDPNTGTLEDDTWTGDAESVTFTASAQARASQIVVTVTAPGSNPSITASNVDIAYDATNGSITYTINNEPDPAGTMTATIVEGGTIANLNLGTIANNAVPFTCDANTTGIARTATVTLTYTYDTDQTVTKDVTITQAAAPVIYTTIPELFAAATSTETSVLVTFNNWVVSGVYSNGKSVLVTDNNGNGFVIYYSSDMSDTYAAGDILSGTAVTCTLKLYNGFAELLNVNVDDLTITEGGTVSVANIEMANLAGVNTGALVHYDNLTCTIDNNKYYLTDGTTTIQLYNAIYAFSSTFEADHIYNITGVYQQYNSTKEILPRSADDIEEVVIAEPSITVDPALVEVDAAEHDGTLTVTYENISELISFDLQFCDANGNELEGDDPDWIDAEIQEENDVYSVYYIIEANEGEARSAYFKVYTDEIYSNLVTINQTEYVPSVVEENYALFTGDLVEGDYLIVYDGSAMNNEVSNNRLQYETVTITNDVITTSNAGIVWHIAPSATRDDYWTIYNASATAYAASNGTKNQAQMLADGTDDKALWTVISGETFDFVNKANAAANVNAYLRNNKSTTQNYGFACYGTGTGGALSLYKKVGPSITVAPALVEAPAAGEDGTLSITFSNMTISDGDQLDIVYYYATGEQITNQEDIPNWLGCIITEDNEAYVVYYSISQSTNTEAQSAYFKVYGLDDDGETEAYSNLVTVTQAAAPQQFDLTVEPFENLELITFVNDEMVMEEDGTIQVAEGAQVMLSIVANEGYVIETLMVNGVDHTADIESDYTYSFEMPSEAVTISATAVEEVVPSPSIWVLTDLADLTEDDIFVIVGTDEDDNTYALPNDVTGNNAPSAVSITVVDGTLSDEPAANYQWNMSGNATNGYTFYVNGDHDNWLYCNTNNASGSNNNMRIGPGGNVNRNLFVLDDDGYLVTTDDKVDRYLSIYFNSGVAQDWRGYINTNSAVAISFYKKVEVPATETYTLDVAGYTEGAEGGYVLIASPVTVDPENVEGMTDGTFDLYYFNQAEDQEWRNYEASHFNLVPGKGYLYAKQATTDGEIFHFELTGTPYNGNGQITLEKTTDAEFEGWNLIGNPFGNAATIDKAYYRLNADGSEVNSETESSAVAVMEGVFVIADTDGETVTFTEQTNPGNSNGISQFSINVSMNRGESIDRAIVRFDNGSQLPKFQLNPNHTKVYIPQGENDYAIVRSANEGEMPVSFKAENNGSYTFSVNTENVEMNYLHLIDYMNGADVDLLVNSTYTFEATTSDYASRFRLVFSGSNVNESTESTTFAYYNGSEWVVSNMGEATLQVVDMLGRIVSSETVNGNATMSTANLGAGVYVMRLMNGENVMTQKIVVR